MSRMFRIITGGNEPLQAEPRSVESPDEVPFVEVGGPEGIVSSVAKPTVRLAPPPPILHAEPLPKPTLTNLDASPQPAVLPMESRVLSVTFHRFPKQGMRVMDSGVAPEIVTYHFPDHPVSAEYRMVRDEILKQYDEPGPKVSLFTAASSIAGTTTVLLNFATTLAHDFGHRVLLLDANFHRPGIARRLSAAESPGLAEVLGQTLPLAWALQPTPLLNLHVLASGTPTDATESTMLSDFPKLLTQLRQWFDWVVVDGGVWSQFPATDATTASCDGIYLVSRQTELERPDFTALRAEIMSNRGPVRGFIATRQ